MRIFSHKVKFSSLKIKKLLEEKFGEYSGQGTDSKFN